jgi:hypothetical protein
MFRRCFYAFQHISISRLRKPVVGKNDKRGKAHPHPSPREGSTERGFLKIFVLMQI